MHDFLVVWRQAVIELLRHDDRLHVVDMPYHCDKFLDFVELGQVNCLERVLLAVHHALLKAYIQLRKRNRCRVGTQRFPKAQMIRDLHRPDLQPFHVTQGLNFLFAREVPHPIIGEAKSNKSNLG